MFLVKYLDQKQGEAKVVDQQQVLRQRLQQLLELRCSVEDLQSRGILGRRERYEEAKMVVEEMLKKRIGAKASTTSSHITIEHYI